MKYLQRFYIGETEREMFVEKARAVAICKTPKHHVDGANLRSGFFYKCVRGILSRFNYI